MTGFVILALFTSCGDKETDSAEGNTKEWAAAELTELTSGDCPDMSISGSTTSFLSSGEERTVTILFPQTPEPKMRIVFFYHGLLNAGSNPTSYMARALDFQSMADEYNSIIILPESPVWELPLVGQFHMWDVVDGTYDKDLQLFDDLRTCAATEFDVDLDKVISAGFSGGALFNTLLLSHRSTMLAAIVEMSGGADLTIPTFAELLSPYTTPEVDVPILLVSGGDSDIWPDSVVTLVDFEEATDTLQAHLLSDDRFVVRCRHNAGHTITQKAFNTTIDWIVNHEYGVDSPYLTDIGSWNDWCEIP